MKVLSILFIGVCMSLGACAQKESLDEMVDGLIEKSVPLAYSNNPHLSTDALFLDARKLEEYETSHIEGALYVGYKNFDMSSMDDVNKDTEIIVYCTVGYRSEKIGEKLIKAGYTNVSNLYGGIFSWVNSGHSVVNENGETQKVHCYNKKWSKWLDVGEKVY